MSDEVDFLHTDKHESLLQIDTMILMGQRRSRVREEVEFLHVYKHQSVLQGDTIIIPRHDQAFSKYSK